MNDPIVIRDLYGEEPQVRMVDRIQNVHAGGARQRITCIHAKLFQINSNHHRAVVNHDGVQCLRVHIGKCVGVAHLKL